MKKKLTLILILPFIISFCQLDGDEKLGNLARITSYNVCYTKLLRIVVKSGLTEFFRDKPVLTYGYNSDVLGPVIRVRRGEVVKIQVKNSLREYTTVHWHGLLVPGDMDGVITSYSIHYTKLYDMTTDSTQETYS